MKKYQRLISRRGVSSALVCAWFIGTASGAAAAEPAALTIYSSAVPGQISPEAYSAPGSGSAVPGFAVVRQEREINLAVGRGTVRFTGVAALIDPTTVTFESLTDREGTQVVEQDFQFDLVDSARLLEKFVDRQITVERQRGNAVDSYTGTLLSTSGGLVLGAQDGTVQIVNGSSNIRLPSMPGGLITRPTLVWEIAAKKGGAHKIRVGYQTGGVAWWADYNAVLSEGKKGDQCRLDLNAWVTILNQSGATYRDARLKLVAGEVNRVRPGRPPMALAAPGAEMKRVPGFEEKAFFEYHLYTLGRPATLVDRSARQIELFAPARGVKCDKSLVLDSAAPYFYGAEPLLERALLPRPTRKVDVLLAVANSRDNNLGMPLPAGRLRVSQLDPADQSLEFLGEDAIGHTPRDERVRIRLGSAFDVVGERKQTDFKLDSARRSLSEDIQIILRNHKDRAVQVLVREPLYRWSNWTVASTSQPYEKEDARTIAFKVAVPANGETVLRYTAAYSW